MNKKKLILIIILISNILIIHARINKNIKIGFSPNKNAKKIILYAIKEAKYSIDIAAYSFTCKEIALNLINAQKKGVKIRVLIDKKSNNNKNTAINYFIKKNILIKLNNKYKIMHNKFLIIDKISVQTGSFNYTSNANKKNAENIVYLKNKSHIADMYIKEFNNLWKESFFIKNINKFTISSYTF